MSITADFIPTRDGRAYSELPKGMSFWWADMQVTGDGTGGSASVTCSFNAQLDNVWMPYVSVDHFGYVTHTAAVAAAGRLFAQAAEWERTLEVAGGYPISVIKGQVVEAATTLQANDADMAPYYLGKAVQPTAARLFVNFDNIDTAVYLVRIGGMFSDKPFVSQNYWRS